MPSPAERSRTVAVALHEPVIGGASIGFLRIVPLLEEMGWRFAFWAPQPGPVQAELERRGYEVAGEPRLLRYSREALSVPPGAAKRLASVPGYLRRFRAWLVGRGPDLLHANTVITIPEAIAATGTRIPVLLHVHEVLPDDRRGRVAARAIRVAADAVVGNSKASVAALRRAGVSASLVHNGVALPEPRSRQSRAPEHLVVGTLGTISRRKGSDLYLDVVERLGRELPRAEFRMVGPCPEGSERDWARGVIRSARAMGVRTGEVSDVFAELSDWDVLVLPSRNEPFGLVVVEAMAAGLPVVATRVGGLPEIVTGESGILVDVDDAEGMVGAVLRLAREPHTRAAMGSAGRARVESEFTLERQAEAMHDAYVATLRDRRLRDRLRPKRAELSSTDPPLGH